jgi:hypothetical protein
MTVPRLAPPGGACERVTDGMPHHELLPQDVHGAPQGLADQWLAATFQEPAQGAEEVFGPIIPPLNDAAGENQGSGRGIGEHGGAGFERVPPGAAQLVAEQSVGRVLVGDTRQGLSESE